MPGWLASLASRGGSYGSSSKRRGGGNRFGGRDFRNDRRGGGGGTFSPPHLMCLGVGNNTAIYARASLSSSSPSLARHSHCCRIGPARNADERQSSLSIACSQVWMAMAAVGMVDTAEEATETAISRAVADTAAVTLPTEAAATAVAAMAAAAVTAARALGTSQPPCQLTEAHACSAEALPFTHSKTSRQLKIIFSGASNVAAPAAVSLTYVLGHADSMQHPLASGCWPYHASQAPAWPSLQLSRVTPLSVGQQYQQLGRMRSLLQ